jgi:hypothetical protein
VRELALADDGDEPAVSSSFTWCEIVAALTPWVACSFAQGM